MKAVGVQFSSPSKVVFFDSGELSLKVGDKVVVQTEEGHELATVSLLPGMRGFKPPKLKAEQNLDPVVRIATDADLKQRERNEDKEIGAFKICKRLIQEIKLPMKLVKAQFSLGGGKANFFFFSEERIDFRELVKRLNQEMGIKIEMSQVGVRDAAGLTGGIGICGREYCCSTFLTSFKPVSIKMAKVQNLSLNPEKVSGGCGRLRCCLTYELDIYHELGKDLPRVGKRVITPRGEGKVRNVEILKRLITVDLGPNESFAVFRPEDVKRPEPQKESMAKGKNQKKKRSGQRKRKSDTKTDKSEPASHTD